MTAVSLSIVIPTRNRSASLFDVLSADGRQTHSDFEIVVVDDGSEDETLAGLSSIHCSLTYPLTVIESPGRGPAVARNKGAQMFS